MNKRFCKIGSYAAKAFFLTAICGATYSCKDDYTLDDTNPSWLGSSIYEYLDNDGNYTNFVKLINDLEYQEVLARTGSKTLFVADDDAFKDFYANNAWGVHSYDQLTKSQKKLLLNNAMINNAYLLEMMSSTPAGGGDNDIPNRGECLRRTTAVDVTDSISYFQTDEIPHSYNPDEKDYWARFRVPGKGIRLAMDDSEPMMLHFLAAQLANAKITDKDFEIITGIKRDKNDAFIYDCKVVKQDVTCQNGYVNVLDKVLITPQNMAEVLRTNGDTKLFSHLMDRFSAPFYSGDLTSRYKLIYGDNGDSDSIFVKSYFSKNPGLSTDYGTDPQGNPQGNKVYDLLPYDPGWNTYYDETNATEDMAAIFCPNDRKMMTYFFGPDNVAGGKFLINAFTPDSISSKINENTTDYELIYKALDMIPRDRINALLTNLMKNSFIQTVPSKFEGIKNTAQDALFDSDNDFHRNKIDKVLLANNGVIYVMDEVITPAEYAAVSAPAYVETNKRVFNWAIRKDELMGIPTTYYGYLLAMSSRFSFFVPRDGFIYVDPISFYAPTIETTDDGGFNMVGRAYEYLWYQKENCPEVIEYKYNYNPVTKEGSLGEEVKVDNSIKIAAFANTHYSNRLKDMLETHTVVHEDNSAITGIDETETGMVCNQKFFVSKNGTVIHVNNADAGNVVGKMTVEGGMDYEGKNPITITGFDDKSKQTNGYGNGFAYMIDRPMQPTIESVYSVLYNNPNFTKFLKLCETDAQVLEEIGIPSSKQARYNIFVNEHGLPCYDYATGKKVTEATNVRLFSNYRYTVYVPTNDAIDKAIERGLPTWQSIRDFLEMDLDPEEKTELTPEQITERNKKATAMVTEINNFVKNHFQDNSIFADVTKINGVAYETATVDIETNIYNKVTVTSNGDGKLHVKDAAGNVRTTTDDVNIVARDYVNEILTARSTKASDIKLQASSAVVIHGIDGVLDYKKYTNNRYDSDWASPARTRAYLKKYAIKK